MDVLAASGASWLGVLLPCWALLGLWKDIRGGRNGGANEGLAVPEELVWSDVAFSSQLANGDCSFEKLRGVGTELPFPKSFLRAPG